jgi:hypothetical protein
MQERALVRRFQRAANEAREPVGAGIGGRFVPFGADRIHEQIQDEIDRRRDHLAEELLKIAIETGQGHDWSEMAKSALAAATVIHPDLPADSAKPEEAPDA